MDLYAPDQSAPNVTMYYSGDDYVDIVALDVYVDDPVFHLNLCFLYLLNLFQNLMKGYDEMIKLNKPFALGGVHILLITSLTMVYGINI